MDYIELAKTTVEFISLGIIGGTLKEIGKDVYENTKQLLQGDELVLLSLLEENPKSEDFRKVVSERLVPRLIENPETASKISELLQKIELNQIKKNTISQTGDSNIAIQDTTNSKITIQK